MSFTKAFVLFLSFALSAHALATPHVPHGLHRALAARFPSPIPADPLASADPTAPVRKRQNKRCRPRSSAAISSSAGQSTKVLVPSVVTTHGASASTSSHEAPPTTTPEISTSTSNEAESSVTTNRPFPSSTKGAEPPVTTKKPSSTKEAEPPVTTKKPSPSSTKEAEPPVTTKKPSSPPSSNLPSFMVGTQNGEGTFYSTGLGACGVTNKDTDHIAAVSHLLFDAFPNYNGINPNDNPVCGRKVSITYEDKSVIVSITDRCTGCQLTDLDLSPSAFDELADPAIGRLKDIQWEWLD